MCTFFVFIGLSVVFFIGHANATNTWTGVKKVEHVQIVETGGILIGLDSEINPVCTDAGTSVLYVYPNQGGMTPEGVKAFLSASLTALASGMSVNIMYDDSTARCYGKYLSIYK